MAEIRGHHVLLGFTLGFGTIIAVNMTLAVNAVRTFPGLEVKNSYVASQQFDAQRTAQEALGWDVSAHVAGDLLHLTVREGDTPIAPVIERAIFGRATSVIADQTPDFTFDGSALVAPVQVGPGNWNLRIEARAADGTAFIQRIPVKVDP